METSTDKSKITVIVIDKVDIYVNRICLEVNRLKYLGATLSKDSRFPIYPHQDCNSSNGLFGHDLVIGFTIKHNLSKSLIVQILLYRCEMWSWLPIQREESGHWRIST